MGTYNLQTVKIFIISINVLFINTLEGTLA